jgi:hypothetical protein
MFMIMFVLDDPARLDEVLSAMEEAGIKGSTIFETTGINRRRIQKQIGAPFMAGINRLVGSEEENHYTLFTIVPTEGQLRACVSAIESVVGDLDEPNTGVLAAWPLSFVKGVSEER